MILELRDDYSGLHKVQTSEFDFRKMNKKLNGQDL